jgi:lysophospholipase L1-like esterase
LSRASRARRIATAAAFGGGSLAGLSAAAAGVVYGETKLARRRIKPSPIPPPNPDGIWRAAGVPAQREPLRIAMLGDSSAAGYGLTEAAETPAAVLALGLSELSRRPVQMTSRAIVGAQSTGLDDQIDQVLPSLPQLVLIMIGANDVTHRIHRHVAVRALAAAVTRLRTAGCEVVVGTCPDLGTIRPIAQPLRFLARRISRTLAAAQTIAVVEAGGRTVSMGDVLGPRFAKERDLFGDDAFHPSARGYAAAIEVALPSAAAALGLPTHAESAGPFLTKRARPIAKAAARAAAHPGTEVAAAQVGGQDRGARGRWARLIRRRPQPVDPDDAMAADHPAPPEFQ